ncbi:hypothetical protein BS47DRAFT_1389486 [Hydnum rufescens UP504]|uniref:Uncharacterized protein n=1 Tax=Hydnum rufescens UP504 TaxID=1448309 RepID=A0A9P6E118_9AGAM|nr:hypothetical protein BS47DRAFT_1389486 [Hydnum rufescens UP504]
MWALLRAVREYPNMTTILPQWSGLNRGVPPFSSARPMDISLLRLSFLCFALLRSIYPFPKLNPRNSLGNRPSAIDSCAIGIEWDPISAIPEAYDSLTIRKKNKLVHPAPGTTVQWHIVYPMFAPERGSSFTHHRLRMEYPTPDLENPYLLTLSQLSRGCLALVIRYSKCGQSGLLGAAVQTEKAFSFRTLSSAATIRRIHHRVSSHGHGTSGPSWIFAPPILYLCHHSVARLPLQKRPRDPLLERARILVLFMHLSIGIPYVLFRNVDPRGPVSGDVYLNQTRVRLLQGCPQCDASISPLIDAPYAFSPPLALGHQVHVLILCSLPWHRRDPLGLWILQSTALAGFEIGVTSKSSSSLRGRISDTPPKSSVSLVSYSFTPEYKMLSSPRWVYSDPELLANPLCASQSTRSGPALSLDLNSRSWVPYILRLFDYLDHFIDIPSIAISWLIPTTRQGTPGTAIVTKLIHKEAWLRRGGPDISG